jgi:hypothetical protein
MSLFSDFKTNAVAVFQAAATALHAQFASALAQAGHPVTVDDHVDTLAAHAATSEAGGTALQTFAQGMTALMTTFAQAHLPAKFQPVAAAAAGAVSDALAGNKSALEDDALKAAAVAVSIAAPEAAPIVAIAEPIAEQALTGGAAAGASTAALAGASLAQTAVSVGETVVEGLANKALPGSGALVGAALEVAASTFQGDSAPDTTPTMNTQGM